MLKIYDLIERLFRQHVIGVLLISFWGISPAWVSGSEKYAVVVSKSTHAYEEWKPVVEALVKKYQGEVIFYDEKVQDSLIKLQKLFPRYVCMVSPHQEVTRRFVADVHQMMRKLDEDPYTDALWGILTGYDAKGALKVASHEEPLTVKKAASGTEIELESCQEGVWFCELKKGHMVRKTSSGKPQADKAPSDTTKSLVDTLNDYQADLFVTSGHATERDWQIGYTYKNGYFRSKDGQLYGADTKGNRFPIKSPNPKVYMPIGNCLMGHIDGPNAMALAFMNSAGVHQMLGYTKVTWYGYGGWGCLDYFVEQPGRFTFTEAYHANHHALIHRLERNFPGMADAEVDARGRPKQPLRMSMKAKQRGLGPRDAIGLLFDRDIVAFYGDPAWEARMAEGNRAYEQKLSVEDDTYSFEILPKLGADSFKPVNTNGAQRGWRPIVHFLPHRVKDVKIVSGSELEPVITDDFLLIPNPKNCDPDKEYKVVFQAERI